MPSIPYIIYGTLTESDVAVASATIRFRNETTNEYQSATTDSSGNYVADAANFSSGYQDGDLITVYCIYRNYDAQETITIDTSSATYNQDLELEEVTDSEDIAYTTVQKVYDELDGKTSSDISTTRIVHAIQWAEGLIDLKTGTSFKVNTATDETHTVDRYSIDTSPDYLDYYTVGTPVRADMWNRGLFNRVKVNNTPIISVSSLSINSGTITGSDSWTALTEQTGSGGDFVVESKEAGIIDFVDDYPRLSKRSWKITYTWGYDPDSTDRKDIAVLRVVDRLAIVLAAKNIITTKSSGSMFDSVMDVSIGSISIKQGAVSTKQYLSALDIEIADLFRTLGNLGIEII